jgi:hypothetical protein
VSAEMAVEVWDNYNVTIRADSTTALVTEELTIKNVIDKPLVPGYGYISLSKEQNSIFPGLPISSENKHKAIEVREISASLDDGSKVKDVFVTEENNSTTIRYGFWTPVAPGECRKIIIEYTTDDIIQKGLLFDRITYTVQPSSIPINNARIEVNLGEGKYLSYSNELPAYTNNMVTWVNTNPGAKPWVLDFEYGRLPITRLPLHWTGIIWTLPLGIICLWSYRQWRGEK